MKRNGSFRLLPVKPMFSIFPAMQPSGPYPPMYDTFVTRYNTPGPMHESNFSMFIQPSGPQDVADTILFMPYRQYPTSMIQQRLSGSAPSVGASCPVHQPGGDATFAAWCAME